MSSISIRTFCLVTLILRNVHSSLEREIPRRSFLSRRAIDGTRGRKYFDPEEEGAFDSYGSAGGQYDPYQEKTDLSDIRRNVPGEPGIDYPAYTTLPQTGFTCEGRSRGYYADQVAGCQVFHVCHDVLVSSFLCPIGSTFSQKLLTCDWWTKVDCSSSDKYIDANRNSYQQDDDEMIRNAYAMVSLQSGTDVTKDGLVDPDRVGSFVNYRQSAGRIPDYGSDFTAGNDLRSNLEEYATTNGHRDPSAYQFENRNPETSQSYQQRPHFRERAQSPYQDSPIIRVQPLDDRGYTAQRLKNKHFQNNYPRPNEFNNQFQPSYAPTVPTVTTTTRRFYSPTVPTTFRPSTLAYNKLDQTIDSSDYFFSRSGTDSFVTPPTSLLSSNDQSSRRILKIPDLVLSRRVTNRDGYNPREVHEFQYNYEDVNNAKGGSNGSPERFQGIQDFRLNRTNVDGVRIFFDKVHQRVELEDEDIEARDSVGLGHALRQSLGGTSIKERTSVEDKAGARKIDSVVGSSVLNATEYLSDSPKIDIHSDYQHTLARPEYTVSVDENKEQTTEQYQGNDKKNDSDRISSSSVKSDVKEARINLGKNQSESSINLSTVGSSNFKKNASSDVKLESSNGKEIIDRMDIGLHVDRPSEFLTPPDETRNKFQIRVPDLTDVSSLLTRYSTLGTGPYPGMRTTELPPFRSTYTTDYIHESTFYDEDLRDTRNYNNEDPLESFNSEKYLTTKIKPEIPPTFASPSSSSPSPLSPRHRPSPPSSVLVPLRSFLSSINYTDNSNDFSTPNEWRFPLVSTNDTEEVKAKNSTTEIRFPVGEGVQGSSIKPACSDRSEEPCRETSSGESFGASSPRTTGTNFDASIATTTVFPSSFYFSEDTIVTDAIEDTATAQPNKETQTPVFIKDTDTVESLKTGGEQSSKLKKTVKHEDLIEAPTANALLESISPETFKQIEETIEKNNSPYQVTLTVGKDEKVVAPEGSLFEKLIVQRGKQSSVINDELHELEVIKSVEPKIHVSVGSQSTITSLNTTEQSADASNFTTVVKSSDLKQPSFNTANLLQLMSELLRLNRAPRPFSVGNTQSEPFRTDTIRDANLNVRHEQAASQTQPQQKLTMSANESSLVLSKKQILDRLTENFGKPLPRTDPRLAFDLPEKDRSLDFRTGFPTNNSSSYQEWGIAETALPTTSVTYSKASTRAIATTTTKTVVTTPTPEVTLTTEPAETVVKTEFLPSIGFSLDTDEGREEYVEAVLGGLIEPQAAETEEKEVIALATTETETQSKNETSVKI